MYDAGRDDCVPESKVKKELTNTFLRSLVIVTSHLKNNSILAEFKSDYF
jgi:hypothetical protein